MPSILALNPWGLLVAALAGYALGAIWFLPATFGTVWMKALGKSPEALRSPGQAMLVTAFTTAITTVTLALVLNALGADNAVEGLFAGLWIGLGLTGATMLSDALFLGWTRALFWTQAGYRMAYVVLICTILGAMP